MPNQDDSQAINGLFDRIEDVSRNSAPRDPDAEQLIQQRLRAYPPAPYYMAQTILIQEQALQQAQQRIEELEAQNAQRGSGGFLGGLFGDEAARRQPAARSRGPWGYADGDDGRQDPRRGYRGGGGGGFLAGAAQTALGVTGGVLLGSAIAGMLTGGAQADEYTPMDDTGSDAGAEDMGGGDDFGGGDFDMGGDF